MEGKKNNNDKDKGAGKFFKKVGKIAKDVGKTAISIAKDPSKGIALAKKAIKSIKGKGKNKGKKKKKMSVLDRNAKCKLDWGWCRNNINNSELDDESKYNSRAACYQAHLDCIR